MVRWEATESRERCETLAPGARLGRYEVLGLLSIGGMAEVYVARVAGLAGFEKLVALKRMLPHFAIQPDFVEMFLAEARLGAMLDHPNVVQVHDIGEEDGHYYCAMEYVRGADLYQLLRATSRESALPLPFAIEIALGVCAGLDHAHGLQDHAGAHLGVVHRDVSLSNVLVSYDGTVKLIDFGVAKVTSDGPRTRVGTLKGKIGYMSPEQCRGEPLDQRSDLFAVGIILYELTTGHRLFGIEHSDYATMQRIISEDPPPPSQLRDGCPPALDAIVLRALERDREARYQTARELRRALGVLAQTERLGTTPVELGEYVRRLAPAAVMRLARAQTERPTDADPLGPLADRLRTIPMRVGSPAPVEAEPPARCLVLPPTEVQRAPRRRRLARRPVVVVSLVAIASVAVAAALLPREPLLADAGRARVAAVPAPEVADAAIEIVADVAIDAGAAAPLRRATPARERTARRAPARAEPTEVEPRAIEPPEVEPLALEPRALEPRALEVEPEVRPGSDAPLPPPETDPLVLAVAPPPPVAPSRPAPRAKLDARATLAHLDVTGALPDSEVRRAVERVLPDLLACYRRAARAAGRAPTSLVELRFEIDENRAARGIQVRGSPAGDFASCVQAVAAKVRTRLPPDVGIAAVTAEVAFHPTP